MFVTIAFNPRIPDLDPITFDAAIPSQGTGRVFPTQSVGAVGCWFFSHPAAIARLEVERKMLPRGRAGFEFLGNLMEAATLP